MEENRLKLLLDKYQENNLSPAEAAELNDWFHGVSFSDAGFEKMPGYVTDDNEFIQKKLLNLKGRIKAKQRVAKTGRLRWLTAAASLLLFITAGSVYFLRPKKLVQQTVQIIDQKIIPGGNRAILTLTNGKQIILGSVKSGKLALQGRTVVNKTAEGLVVYNDQKNERPGAQTSFNTIATPRGGTYQVVLSDGTKAWLNAASSIRYPVAFSGKERKVYLTGEAYFEVAHNKAMPFKVITKSLQIEVLGTHFNVNAYDDEPSLKTTLIAGRVKLTPIGNDNQDQRPVILMPGQQATQKDGRIALTTGGTSAAMAWKNGMFHFESENIRAVIRQVSRWYNIDPEYNNIGTTDRFTGEISRQAELTDLLKILEISNVHFRVIHREKTNILSITP